MVYDIPKKVKGVIFQKEGEIPKYGEMDMPELKEGNILVKVEAAPINPTDLSALKGQGLGFQTHYPNIPGKEAAGIVVAAKGQKEEQLIGKRIACFTNLEGPLGGFGEYCLTSLNFVMELPDDIDFETGSCGMINPFTVCTMLEAVKSKNVKTVVHNVGASQLGKQMQKLFNENGIEVINIVRREEQVKELKERGQKHVLNQSDSNFWEVFKQLAQKLDAKIAFDAIGGEYCAQLVKNMPFGSTVYVYGLLSGQKDSNIDTLQCLLDNKNVSGFVVYYELQQYPHEKVEQIAKKVSSELKTTFSTEISQKIQQKDFQEGLDKYLNQMSAGKTILIP